MENPNDSMSVWISNKVIHIISVDKNPMLTILMYMWINKLGRYDSVIDCDDTSCVLRYSREGETLAVMRYTYMLNVGKRVRQDVIQLRTMDINNLIGDIMIGEDIGQDMAEYVTTIIRMDATHRIKQHLTPDKV